MLIELYQKSRRKSRLQYIFEFYPFSELAGALQRYSFGRLCIACEGLLLMRKKQFKASIQLRSDHHTVARLHGGPTTEPQK